MLVITHKNLKQQQGRSADIKVKSTSLMLNKSMLHTNFSHHNVLCELQKCQVYIFLLFKTENLDLGNILTLIPSDWLSLNTTLYHIV